jgi:glycosyltransferase involved in cell wall biosynthesis
MSEPTRLPPVVTIITATFNAAATLEACLASVRAQDYPHIEHLILDGGSKDKTLEILQKQATPGSWISEPDRGIYDAWNKGLARAQGEWIAFLGADDTFLPGAVSAYMELAAQHPEAQYISSRVRWIGPRGRTRLIGKPWRWPRFQRYMCTAHVGSMHHRRFFEQFGQYDIKLPIVADYEMLLRAGPTLRTAFLPQVTVEMQGGGNSDNVKAIEEATLVKIVTGKRKPWLVHVERFLAHLKFHLRRLLPFL